MRPVISRSLVTFSLLFFGFTLLFRAGLSHFIDENNKFAIMAIAITYGVVLFATGWILGKADGIERISFDLGLRFHLFSFVMWTAASLLWFVAGFNSPKEHISQVYGILLIWGIVLAIHILVFLIVRRKTIRGVHKSEIFE